ncbi:MAG: hypothetical protein WHT08_03955 [Bryobacteraceae bacterium]|jgi:hypothetical protein
MPALPLFPDTAAGSIPLIGRHREARVLSSLLLHGSRAAVFGPRGIGKTRLVQETMTACGILPLVVNASGPLHEVLDGIYREMVPPAAHGERLPRLTSQALQARVLRALEASPRWLWIDDPPPAGARFYRFLQRVLWIEGCGLVASAVNRAQLGWLGRLVWDPREELLLQPLGRAASAGLLEEAIRAFGLESRGSLGEFRRHVLSAAEGNPGRIVTLCRLAAQPQYWRGGHLMFAPLWIDTLTQLA